MDDTPFDEQDFEEDFEEEAELDIGDDEPHREVFLNDFSHRQAQHSAISDPGDTVIEPTPAQRERVVYLVDKALDVTEAAMYGGDWGHKLKAAESILDRAGVAKIHKTETKNVTPSVPAEALTQVLGGLASMFGARMDQDIKMAAPTAPEALTSSSEPNKPYDGANMPAEKPAKQVEKPPKKKKPQLPQEVLDRM